LLELVSFFRLNAEFSIQCEQTKRVNSPRVRQAFS
jgi:hypothetical protein